MTTTEMAPVPVGNPLLIFALMGVCYLGTMWFGTVSYRLAPITYVTGLQNLPIIWLAVFDFVFAGIHPKPELFLGAFLIIASGIYLVSPTRKSVGIQAAFRNVKARFIDRI